MATDTNKKSASGDQDATSTVKVGEGGTATSRPRLHIPFLTRKKVFIIILVVAVVVYGLFAGLHVGQKVYAQAAGHKIYKQDVKDLIGKNKGVSDHQAATVLADQYLTQALAKEEKITVTDKDIQAQYGPGIEKLKASNKYSYQLQVNKLYFSRLAANNRGIYKGNLLVAHFSRYIAFRPLTADQQAAIPKMGNADAIAQDKKYAQTLITNLYNRINAGKLTFAQAAQIERSDPTVGLNMYPSLTHSGPFDTTLTPNSLLNVDSIRQQVSSIKAGQTSKPFVVRVGNSVDTGDSSTVESYFLVVHMNQTSGGHGNPDFQKYLSDAEKRLGYKVNV